MFVYLQGDPVKGVVARHTVIACPGGHLGVSKVPSAWTEVRDGTVTGKTFHIEFVNGVACPEDALGEYLIQYGHALRERWRAPAGSPIAQTDPFWRWRADAAE
jgi:hypothetical protein